MRTNMAEDIKRLIRIKQVVNLTGLSKSYVYQLAKERLFPKPVKLVEGGTASAWVLSEVTEWINSKIQERNQ